MFEIRVQPTESDLRCAWEARKLWGSIPYGVPSGKASPRTERVFELFSAILFSLKHEGQRLFVVHHRVALQQDWDVFQRVRTSHVNDVDIREAGEHAIVELSHQEAFSQLLYALSAVGRRAAIAFIANGDASAICDGIAERVLSKGNTDRWQQEMPELLECYFVIALELEDVPGEIAYCGRRERREVGNAVRATARRYGVKLTSPKR